MSLESRIKDAFETMAAEVEAAPPALERAAGRARRRYRNRRVATSALAAAAVIAASFVVPRVLDDRPNQITFAPVPEPQMTSSPVDGPGLHLTLALPRKALTGQVVEATVAVDDDSGSLSHVAVLWGDTPGQFGMIVVDCAAQSRPSPTSSTKSLTHGYRTPGTYQVRVQVITGQCEATDQEEKVVEGTIKIEQGTSPSNGPLLPEAVIENRSHLYEDIEPLETAWWLAGGDEDGYIRIVEVEWGDGTGIRVVDASLSECRDPGTTWPSNFNNGMEVRHVYPAPGRYELRVHVTSTGCDGRDLQESGGAWSHVLPR